jgi:gluconokinase
MGVAGSGKTTIGKLLAEKLHWDFADADDFHPEANVNKMSAGIALTDEDREPWLEKMRDSIRKWIASNQPTILACSALKESYRNMLQVSSDVCVVYLSGSFELFEQRLRNRKGHFMKPDMLRSQFLTLEEPAGAVIVNASESPDAIVDEICRSQGLSVQGTN